jgi:quinolinate synthase
MKTVDAGMEIEAIRKRMGQDLVILAHHYQKDEVIQHADFRGDSLKLSQCAAQEKNAKYIVFCGVHFMAETADILTQAEQKVLLPDLAAGCPMAEMAEVPDAEACFYALREAYGDIFVPVTYVNSSAAIKAFCGANGGMTCTSSNADKIFREILENRKQHILFLPDEHLGRNTGNKFGLPAQDIFLWSPGMAADLLPATPPRLIVWKGFCCVHQRFTEADVRQARMSMPGVKVIVHPECCEDVVNAADDAGSTEYIINVVTAAPAGSKWAVGTEANLVKRLQSVCPEQTIVSLLPEGSYCGDMNLLDEAILLATLQSVEAGEITNQVAVATDIAAMAKVAVQRMLDLS